METGTGSRPPPAPERKLALLMEIDRLRDETEDPGGLLGGIVEVMADSLQADTSLLFVIEPTSDRQELRAVLDRAGIVGEISAEALRDLSNHLREDDTPEVRVGSWTDLNLDRGGRSGQFAIVPIVMGGKNRVGSLILGRKDRRFEASELDLMVFAETQLDSALLQAQRIHDLDLRNRELEAIYRVDRIRDTPLGFDEMLDRVLNELRKVIRSDLAFIMLYDRTGKELELRASSPGDLTGHWPGAGQIQAAAWKAVESGELVLEESRDPDPTTILCVPLILRDEVLGVFGMANGGEGEFRKGEQRLLKAIASQIDTAIFENLEQGRLRQVLGRTVDPQVLERLLEHSVEGILEGERQVLTILYADLRGSTFLAETADPRDLVEFINDYLGEMAEIIVKHGGTLDKFMGDEVMAIFGAPLPQEDHAVRAVRVGLEMQDVHHIDPPPLGVGIATGEVIVGEMGSGRRSDYTVLGASANLGARICQAAEGGQVLVNAETYRLLGGRAEARPIPNQRFKGIPNEVTVYDVTGMG